MNGGKGPWYLLTGLLIGLLIGLIYAWLIEPVEYIDTAPHSLSPAIKERYRSLISLAYQSDGDIGRARQRLALLQDNNPESVLAAQAQQEVANSGSPQEAQALALLAEDINQSGAVDQSTAAPSASQAAVSQSTGRPTSPSRPQKTATSESDQAVRSPTPRPTKTNTPAATFTPRVTATVETTLGPPFALKDKQKVCDANLPSALLQVEVEDGSNQPVAGVRLDVTWNGGEDFFYTGLYPRITNGYGDFSMSPGVTYSLRAGEGGQTVSGLTAPADCKKSDGTTYTGGWMLTFAQP